MENLEFSKPGLTWSVTMIPRDYGHDRVCEKDACFEFQTRQAYACLCPLIDLFHLATIDKAWDLRKRSSKRKTPRCLCGVSTLIYHILIFDGRR